MDVRVLVMNVRWLTVVGVSSVVSLIERVMVSRLIDVSCVDGESSVVVSDCQHWVIIRVAIVDGAGVTIP